MLSLSDNEFSVLNFLVRNFTERLTIRSIAQRLKFSPAGVFNILKKLEKQNIVTGEKLGTGLFYSINFENRIAEYLAKIVLLYSEEKINIDVSRLKQANAAILDKKTLLLITDSVSALDISISDFDVITKTEDEVVEMLKKKDAAALQLLRNGTVLFGEDKIADIIKKCVSRF
ncbi:MarR family transcriptional regulator [Candidatus Woesearchaeota archaeon]|nr:MarR family transcriptional regulator [Candidatus Woesearchaeota archaeon]